MSTNQLDTELAQLREQKKSNLSQWDNVMDEISSTKATDRVAAPLMSEADRLISERLEIVRAIDHNQSYYRRPSGKITGLFSRPLGPLPYKLKDTKIDTATEEVMATLPSYRLAALSLLIGVVGSLVTLSLMLPWLMVSPLSLVMGATSGADSSTVSMVIIVIVAVLITALTVTVLYSRDTARRVIYGAAHDEEKWFRSGAENWTLWQRLVSCLLFGFCHVVNIIYPLLTLVILSLAGAAFMAVYLKEYRRSGDVNRATLAATKLHAQYNIYAVWFIGSILVLFAATSLL